MENIVEQGLLYDFYGELLTEHQKQIYEEAVYHDMSLSEIAEVYGISRQGVHDLIQRCNKLLQSYEDKLHLVRKFTDAKKTFHEINRLARLSKEMPDSACREQIDKIQQLVETLNESF